MNATPVFGTPDQKGRALGCRRTSRLKLLGLPLYDIWYGQDPANENRTGTARGILAIGTRAIGVVAIGHFACGFFSFGIFSFGLISSGVLTSGLLAVGVVNVALVAATGVCSLAPYAFGVLALGSTVAGVVPLGAKVLAVESALRIALAPVLILPLLAGVMRWLPIILMSPSRTERLIFIRGGLFHTLAFTGGLIGCTGTIGWFGISRPAFLPGLFAGLALYGIALILELHLERRSRQIIRGCQGS